MLYRNGKKIDPEESMDDEEGSSGGLIPKSLLPDGAKVGDTVKFKIAHLFDDEAEIQYSRSGKDKSEGEDESQKPALEEEGMEELTADA